ncbi:MAG: hypothetical protein VXW43_19885, partial [Pseudomonadota bacterium]|nr:hypothetical protein [Pseudomonadota bacterium]
VAALCEEYLVSGELDEAVRCIKELEAPSYHHEVIKRLLSAAIADGGSREHGLALELTRTLSENATLTPEQLAGDYYTSSGSAVSAAVRGGGGTSGDFLSEHGMIEHRVAALRAGKYALEAFPPVGKGKSACATLGAGYGLLSYGCSIMGRSRGSLPQKSGFSGAAAGRGSEAGR